MKFSNTTSQRNFFITMYLNVTHELHIVLGYYKETSSTFTPLNMKHLQVECPLSKMPGRPVSNVRFRNICTCVIRYLEMGPKSKHKIHDVSYTPYTHTLNVILVLAAF
jgi:hypothetical protein